MSGKIAVGFLAVLSLHIIVAVMSHLGQERARSDLESLEQGHALTRRMLEVDRLVGELQGNIQGYALSGNKGLKLRSEQACDALRRHLGLLSDMLPAEDLVGVVEMQASLENYANDFRLASEDRAYRERLVQFALPECASRGRQLILNAQDELHGSSRDSVTMLRKAAYQFVMAQNCAHQYLAQLSSESMRSAHDAVGKVRVHVERALGRADKAASLLAVCDDFERILVGLVQSTRGYLHLVHVVMAAQAVEFLRESASLREREVVRIESLQASIRDQQESYQWLSALVSIATIVLGLAAGCIVGRLVVRPLQAITATLGRLTRGEEADIPGLHRSDEIGDMAAAAQRLRERNEEAVKLLAKTSRLSLQRERMIADLERINRDLDNFAHIAAHDLKAPLRGIYTIVRWLRQDCGHELSDIGLHHLDLLQQRVSGMSQLLADLQDYSRVSREGDSIKEVDVVAVVNDVVGLLDFQGFSVVIEGSADVRLKTAPVALSQALSNVLSNCVSHHDRRVGEIRCKVQKVDGGVSITITDDGPGISPEYHHRVFEPFETLKPRSGSQNSGVGLAIVRKLVDRYGASINIVSPVAYGRGTSFVIFWPDSMEAPSMAPQAELSKLSESLA